MADIEVYTVVDEDGKPFYVAADSPYGAHRMERELRREAQALGCNMRNIPRLGSPGGWDWHPAFRVTEEDGIVVRVERLRRIARPRDPT